MIKYKMRRKGIVYSEYFNCGRRKEYAGYYCRIYEKGRPHLFYGGRRYRRFNDFEKQSAGFNDLGYYAASHRRFYGL